ncbi:MAG: VWA domain-containing protein [Acidobacteria bacterium]|nr:VWA domain-containing protein [Acidobacteriota bacterium]
MVAQRPAPPQETAPPIRVEVELVNIAFSVLDKRNHFVMGLGPDDFTVFEDGVPQDIKFFDANTNMPLRIGLVIDTSNSVRPRFQFEQEAAIDFLFTVIRPDRDQGFVVAFDSTVWLAQGFTSDPQDLADAIRSLRAGGGTALFDAIYLACKELMAEGETDEIRKMLIVLSDGEENAQSIVTREEAIEMARRTGVTIFTVSTNSPPTEHKDARYLQEPCKVMKARGDKILERLAEATGGRAFCPFNPLDVGQTFQKLADQLRHQYQLAYTPTNQERDGRFRVVEIHTRREGMRVFHRPGYVAVPVAQTPAS